MKKALLPLLFSVMLYASAPHSATLLESIDSGGYTYMKVQEGKKRYWIAMTQRDIKVGDSVEYTEQIWMQEFHSKTLDRTFDSILFAGDIVTPASQQKHKLKKLKKVQKDILESKYKESDTLTIAELFKNRDKYVDKEVTIKGEVTKASLEIMGLNWIHIEDGSRFGGMDELVFTSKEPAPKEGAIVYAKGRLLKDKDFGYGYFYPLIAQEAHFKN